MLRFFGSERRRSNWEDRTLDTVVGEFAIFASVSEAFAGRLVQRLFEKAQISPR
jgi:hypothetical protein